MSAGFAAKLKELDTLRADGVISDAEYAEARRSALNGGAAPALTVPLQATMAMPIPANGMVMRPAGPAVLCPLGHPMTFYQGDGWGSGTCRGCMFKYYAPHPFYMCNRCYSGYCQGCVANGVNRPLHQPDDLRVGLCGCCEEPNRCADFTICCSCFLCYARRFEGFNLDARAPPAPIYSDYCGGVVLCLAEFVIGFGIQHWVVNYRLRKSVVRMYGLEEQEDRCISCMKSGFCCLSANQMYREMKSRGHDIGGTCLAPPAPMPEPGRIERHSPQWGTDKHMV